MSTVGRPTTSKQCLASGRARQAFGYNPRMDTPLLINILGWTGSILYLLAYALVSMKKTDGDSLAYQGMNIVAGILLINYTLTLNAYASTGLNAVWVAIGLFTLGKKWLDKNKVHQN
jgi:phosphatidylserine synthase